MKTTVLIAIFISCCFAQTCMVNSVQCADIGDSCSNGCPGCFDAFQTCLLSATNATEQCACGEEFVNCYADAKDGTCSSYSAYAQCIALDPTCPCGTPYTGPTVTTNCDNNAYCSSAGKCVAVKAVGAACNMSNECGDSSGSLYGNSYSCVNNKCQMDASAMPGDACSKDSDCAYFVPASLGCVSGKCASQAAGKACVNTTDSLDCGPGLYCDSTNTCKNTIAMGAACDHSSDDECGVTGTCSSTDVCIKMFSKTTGQACKYDQECANGLYCSESSGTCATVLASDVSCMNVTQCTDISDDYIACSCNAMGDFHCQAPTGPSAQCKDLLAAFGQCVSDNGCSEDSHIAGGCIATNCASQISCYFKCLAENGETLTNAFGCVANYEDSCGAGTTGSTTSMGVKEVASAGLVALAVAALL